MKLPGRTFWLAQLGGWGAYVLVLWLGSAPNTGWSGLAEILPHKLTMGVGGVLSSTLLWFLYARLLPPGRPLLRQCLTAAVLSFAAGLLWSAFVLAVMRPEGGTVAKGSSMYGIALLAWSALYLAFATRDELESERARALRADALASEARLAMLRYQVNPHFLFNALNSIRALIEEDPRRAREMVTELAELFRYSLVHGRDGDAPLADELAAVRSYLAIQRIRFEDRLDADVSATPAALEARLPAFLVHPLVENAVKHGMETSAMPLRVRLTATLAAGRLEVEVANTGRIRPPSGDGTGTGLENVRQRLAQLRPGRHRVDLAEEDGWVKARLSLETSA